MVYIFYSVESSLSVVIKTENLRIVTHEEKKKNEMIAVATATVHRERKREIGRE